MADRFSDRFSDRSFIADRSYITAGERYMSPTIPVIDTTILRHVGGQQYQIVKQVGPASGPVETIVAVISELELRAMVEEARRGVEIDRVAQDEAAQDAAVAAEARANRANAAKQPQVITKDAPKSRQGTLGGDVVDQQPPQTMRADATVGDQGQLVPQPGDAFAAPLPSVANVDDPPADHTSHELTGAEAEAELRKAAEAKLAAVVADSQPVDRQPPSA
jgi:hypothetical protein